MSTSVREQTVDGQTQLKGYCTPCERWTTGPWLGEADRAQIESDLSRHHQVFHQGTNF